MGFGRGVGFTAIKERVTLGAIVSKTVGGVSLAKTTATKLFSSKTAIPGGVSLAQSTAGKLVSTRVKEVTAP